MILAERHYVKFGLWHRNSVCLSVCLSVCRSSVHPDLGIKLLSDFFHRLIARLSDNFHVENHAHRATGSPRRSRARPKRVSGYSQKRRIWTYRKRCYL